MNLLHCSLISIGQRKICKNIPLEFSQYPTKRIIIDFTKIFIIEDSSTMPTQSQTWSSLNTITIESSFPNGTLTYISGLWGGKVSDKEITKKCGFLDLMEPGDNIMADCGFDIRDILPGRSQLSAKEVNDTMDMSSVRIHVEGQIGSMKNYHI
ncbi:hypothetical protein MAR_028007 [Mya arenaria]|uniref:DDE Tnp4 domain-containing protein n=1 Tax=Mya arenaria TaxID=6604 RepID=A0ABY7DCC4_MYAAR|nr:hypothetical protein MAR_028007 [Mya arenaria]